MKYSKFFKFLEKKDHLINKLESLTDEQKEEVIAFFAKHPKYESEIDWNRKDLEWDDFEEVIYKERISGAQLKNFVKKDKHFLVLYSDSNCVLFQPLTWLGSRYLASTDVKPKIEGKWCISYQKNRNYWDSYSFENGRSFIFLCTSTTKYALETSLIGTFVPWDAEDSKLKKSDFYNEVSKEVPNIESLLKKYIPIAISNHSLVEQMYRKDLEESAYIEKVRKEERKYRIKIFPKSFKKQVKKKGYYSWDGDITYQDLKDFGLVDEKGKVDERFKYFRVSGNLNFIGRPITSITIPKSITSIERGAFADCTSLKEINIPDSVTSIKGGAFCDCKALTEINIPGNVTSIGSNAFADCISLTKITIPDSVVSIGSTAFYGCTSLTSIAIPKGVKKIDKSTFERCTSLTEINIPESIESIGNFAFERCSSLTSVAFPDTVTSIGGYVFSRCSSLTEVTIPDSVTKIGNYIFDNCFSLKSIYINKEKDSLDLSKAGIPSQTKVYWKGEF